MNKKHWEENVEKFGMSLTSTTKTETIKKLEVDALTRTIKLFSNNGKTILEVGCGNGHNIFHLSKTFPTRNFTGIDYVDSMIKNAKVLCKNRKNVNFYTEDIFKLDKNKKLLKEYDIIFSDRCLINLQSDKKQKKGFLQMVKKTKKDGIIICLENFVDIHKNQNSMRKMVGLPARKIAEYNKFIDVLDWLNYTKEFCNLIHWEDYSSLHDLILYVILPMTNGGKIEYDHPIVKAITDFCLEYYKHKTPNFGTFNQNRLYVFRKK
jgi:ubiquinone/menaquinone biosynthesis C-methylase UbiE